MKKVFFAPAFAAALALASCQMNAPDATPKAVWKVLWLICPDVRGIPVGGDSSETVDTHMTAEEIARVNLYAPKFEAFVESHANGMLDIVMDIQEAPTVYAGTDWTREYQDANLPDVNYDSLIMSVDYTGVNTGGGFAFNSGFRSCIFWWREAKEYTREMTEEDMRFKTNLYVHEWIHQLEGVFSEGNGFGMPSLHGAEEGGLYDAAHTGIADYETRMAKWYGDILQGTVVKYPGSNTVYTGVSPDWWQYTPLWRRGGKTISPPEGSVGVSVSDLTVVVKWDYPVAFNKLGLWKNGVGFGNAEGFDDRDAYFILSPDGKTLTVFYSAPKWATQFGAILPNTAYKLESSDLYYIDDRIQKLRGNADFTVNVTTGGGG